MKEEITWTDELFKEYGKYCILNNSYLQLDDFIKSKKEVQTVKKIDTFENGKFLFSLVGDFDNIEITNERLAEMVVAECRGRLLIMKEDIDIYADAMKDKEIDCLKEVLENMVTIYGDKKYTEKDLLDAEERIFNDMIGGFSCIFNNCTFDQYKSIQVENSKK